MRAFYDTEECVCKIWVISIFQNIQQDHFEILHISSLKKWKKNVLNGCACEGIQTLASEVTDHEGLIWIKPYTINNFSKFQNNLAEYFEI